MRPGVNVAGAVACVVMSACTGIVGEVGLTTSSIDDAGPRSGDIAESDAGDTSAGPGDLPGGDASAGLGDSRGDDHPGHGDGASGSGDSSGDSGSTLGDVGAELIVLDGVGYSKQPDVLTTWTEIEVAEDRILAGSDGAALFRLHPGDYVNGGVRAEIREELLPSALPEGQWVYFEFTIQLPAGWETDRWQEANADAVVLQTKNGDGSPPISLHLSPNQGFTFKVLSDRDASRSSPAANGDNHIFMALKFSRDTDGRLVASHNGNQIIDFHGPTLTPASNHFFSKHGLYRPQWNSEPYDPDRSLLLQYGAFEQGLLR